MSSSTPPPPPSGGPQSADGGSGAGGGAAGSINAEEVLENFEKPSIGILYSDRQPKNFTAGIASGAKNFGRGVLAGVGALVALPVVGAKSDGAKGLAKGLALGAVSLVGLSVGGAVTGARQIFRGAVNSVEYVRETYEAEKVWDDNKREWRTIDLDEMTKELPFDDTDLFAQARRAKLEKRRARKAAAEAEAGGGTTPPPQQPSGSGTGEPSVPCASEPSASTAAVPNANPDDACVTAPWGYYAILGVPKTASTSEIKKAFAKRALQLHPDKNVGRPDANLRFQALNTAYQTLSNEVRRAEYDQQGGVAESERAGGAGGGSGGGGGGGAAGASAPPVDERHPMEDVLGGPQLEPFTGRMRLFIHMNSQVLFSEQLLATFTERRTLRCARYLANLVDHHGPDFASFQQHALPDMVLGPEAPHVMLIVGKAYVNTADGFLGRGVIGATRSMLADTVDVVATTGSATSAIAKAAKAVYNQAPTPDDVTPVLLMLARDEIDVTARLSCEMALHDKSVSHQAREIRARRIKVLGKLIEDAAHAELARRAASHTRLLQQGPAAASGAPPQSPPTSAE